PDERPRIPRFDCRLHTAAGSRLTISMLMHRDHRGEQRPDPASCRGVAMPGARDARRSPNPATVFPDARNRLIEGDCLAVMRALPAQSIDLIYVDPPF